MSGDISLTLPDIAGSSPGSVSGADPFKIVEIDKYGQPQLVLDLEDYDGVAGSFSKERDSFRLEPGAPTSRDVDLPGRRGGTRAIGIDHPNYTLGATFTTRGPDADGAIAAAETLAKHVDDVLLRPRRYVQWSPRGATKASYYEPRGPGAPGLSYRSIVFQQLHRFGVQMSWPIAPYALDLPMRWTDPLTPAAALRDEWSRYNGLAPNTAFGTLVPAEGDSKFVHMRHQYGASERLLLKIGRQTTPPAGAQYVGINLRWKASNTSLWLRLRTNSSPRMEFFAENPFGLTTGPTQTVTFAAGAAWMGLRIDGNLLAAEWWNVGHTPDFDLPDTTSVWDLAAAGISATYGQPAPVGGTPQDPVKGRVGMFFSTMPVTVADRPTVQQIRVTPVNKPSLPMPAIVEISNVPGDLEPKIDVELTCRSATPAAWAGIGWNSKLHTDPAAGPALFGKIDSGVFDFSSPGFTIAGSVYRHAVGAAAVDVTAGTVAILAPAQAGELDPDDFMSGQLPVEVFAMLTVPSTIRQLRAALQIKSTGGGRTRTSLEWGPTGRPITTPFASRTLLYKLGTVMVEPESDLTMQVQVYLGYAIGSSGNLDVDYLWAVPASRSARKRDGIALDSSYPALQLVATDSTRIASDLTAKLRSATDPDRLFPHTGLGGAPIEPDAPRRGGVDLTVHAGQQVPDTPIITAPSEDPAHQQTVRANIWPRYRIAVHG